MISSFCSGADCIEVELTADDFVRVTSTNVADEAFLFTPEEWTAFVAGVKAGEFDLEALA